MTLSDKSLSSIPAALFRSIDVIAYDLSDRLRVDPFLRLDGGRILC
jgi:hypothetical protein